MDIMRSVTAYRWMARIAVLACGMLAGCAASKDAQPSSDAEDSKQEYTAPITNTDACAGNLHDICGALLMYYLTHQDLPERLEDLGAIPGHDGPAVFICPIANRPYIYDPVGILLPEKRSRIILYDSVPAHSGMRWAITVDDVQPDSALVAKVIALPESVFRFQSAID